MKSNFFIDSNVWFSVFYSKGNCYKLIKKLLEHNKEIVVSKLVIEETFRNIYKKVPQALPALNNFFCSAPITILENPEKKQLNSNLKLADKKDLPIILSAINYNCDYLVTRNVKDFNLKNIKNKIKILTPQQALSLSFES